VTFTDAAAKVLEEAEGRPVHYRDILARALSAGFVTSGGQTPEKTLNARMHEEILLSRERGLLPRFESKGNGIFAITTNSAGTLETKVASHNLQVFDQVHRWLRGVSPSQFEQLVGSFLGIIGFESIEVTRTSGDGGIDVRGVLVIGDVVRIRMAVQAKRTQTNVQRPVVQQLRGSLGAHEQGLVITTAGFSSGARAEAQRNDASPVALLDGNQLSRLLAEGQIAAHRKQLELYTFYPGITFEAKSEHR
jgi:restriction system protein